MTDWVRCQNDAGQFTLSRTAAESLGVQILDGRPAVDAVGRPLPAKPRTSKGGKPRTKQPEPRPESEE